MAIHKLPDCHKIVIHLNVNFGHKAIWNISKSLVNNTSSSFVNKTIDTAYLM